MIRLLIPGALALILVASAAAQETPTSAAAKFSREFAASDTDKNGALSLAEVQARTARMRVGPQKDPGLAKKLATLWFARADVDKDRRVTEPEAQALLAATFRRYDANRDGRIGTAERGAAKKAIEKGR